MLRKAEFLLRCAEAESVISARMVIRNNFFMIFSLFILMTHLLRKNTIPDTGNYR